MRKRFTQSQIFAVLKEGELSADVRELCRQHGISRNTYYNWKNKYGGMSLSEAQQKRDLEIEALKELLSKNW